MLASTKPFLITTLRSVPPGTNGGVTPWGFLVSLLGGLLIGVAATISLLVQNPKCNGLSVAIGGVELPWWAAVVAVGGASGFVGSLVRRLHDFFTPSLIKLQTQIDSILGATLQQSLYSETKKKIVHSKATKEKDEKIVVVSGSDVLSNNAVNILSSTLVGAVTVWLAGP